MNGKPRSQAGVALVTVLMVVAIATVIASEIVVRVNFNIQRAENQQLQAQAYQYALGGEELIKQILHQDFKKTKYDHLEEKWSQLKPQYEFKQGKITIQVVDLHSRLNINNLISSQGRVIEPVYNQFRQLFSELDISRDLLNTLVDWLDKDSTPIALNSEDIGYLSQKTPYRAANGPIVHLSELTLVKGWERQHLELLAPYITALPLHTQINVNTASASVLATLSNDLSSLGGVALVESQHSGGFDTMDSFVAHPALAGLEINIDTANIISQYFGVYVESHFADRTIRLFSILHRDPESGKIELVSRDRTSRFLWPELKS